MLNTTAMKLVEHGEVKLVPTENFHLYLLGPLIQKILCTVLKETHEHHPATHHCFENDVLPVRYGGAMVARNLWE